MVVGCWTPCPDRFTITCHSNNSVWLHMEKIRWYITEDCVCAQMSLHRALEMAHNPPDLWISAASLSQVLRPVHRHQRHFSKVVITHYLPTRLLLSGRPGILDTNYDVFLLFFFPLKSRQKHYFVKSNRDTQNWLITFMAPYEKTLRTLHLYSTNWL